MDSIRNIRQKEFGKVAMDKKRGLLHLTSRFGKIRTCFSFIKPTDVVLVIYPKLPIKDSWIEEAKICNFNISNFTFTSTASLKKYVLNSYDWVIWDEPQEVLLPNFLGVMQKVCKQNHNVIGLSGSLSERTQNAIFQSLGLRVIAEYTTNQAIAEGVVTDYRIYIKYVELEKDKKAEYKRLGFSIQSAQESNKHKIVKFLALRRMRLLYSSRNKLEETLKLIDATRGKRFILFSHLTKFADSLGIPVYHSKNKDKEILEQFKNGTINELATLDMVGTGVSFKNLNRAIVATFTSNSEELYQRINRITAIEMNNPDKIARVCILCLKDTQEEVWLEKSLKLFDKNKIIVI
jgi:superfamily II DNA or RNA helicase